MKQGMAVVLSLFLPLCGGCATHGDGIYYQSGAYGNAVEFRGDKYVIRTHNGNSIHEGAWKDENGSRVVLSCCQRLYFRPGKDNTLIDDEGRTWVGTPPKSPLQDVPRAPLRIEVVEDETYEPITNFSYRYWISSPKGEEYPTWLGMKQVHNSSGTLVINAPLACELGVRVDALDYLCHGSGFQSHSFDIQPSDTSRVVTVQLQRGLTVEGKVVDADTGMPIAGAIVAPLVEYHPSEVPNRYRQVTTDESGNFRVHAATDWRGISVDHEKYGQTTHRDRKQWQTFENDPWLRRTTISVKKAQRIAGTVKSSEGTLLAGVKIESYNGRRTETGTVGTFEIYGASTRLYLSLPHFIKKEVKISSETKDLTIVLEPQFHLFGRAITREGDPVTNFTVVARDGPYSGDYWETEHEFHDKGGRFSFDISEPVTNLVAVVANGFAFAQAPAILTRPPKPLTIVMQKGVTVTGRIELPGADIEEVKLSLAPQRHGDLWRNYVGGPAWVDSFPVASSTSGGGKLIALATKEVSAASDGKYRFLNVAPGSYTLAVSGEGIVPTNRTVRIADKGRQLPSLRISPLRFGAVEGQIFKPYYDRNENGPVFELWPFADGRAIHRYVKDTYRDGIPFKADENGRYCVTNIPIGPVSICVNHNVTFDIIDSMYGTGVVHAGQTTVIDVLPEDAREPTKTSPARKSRATVTLKIGDGSEEALSQGTGYRALRNTEGKSSSPEWTLILSGRLPEERSWKSEASAPLAYTNLTFIFDNLYAGEADLQLDESESGKWRADTLWCSEKPIIVGSATNTLKTINLPANSAFGYVRGPENRWATDVYCLDEKKGSLAREIEPLDNGFFLAKLLPKGTYTFLAYKDDTGWCCRTGITIKGQSNLGDLHLKAGATVTAQLVSDWSPVRGRYDFRVNIKDSKTGIALKNQPDKGTNGGSVIFKNIWPGNWKLTLCDLHDETLFSTNISVKGTERISLDMPWTE